MLKIGGILYCMHTSQVTSVMSTLRPCELCFLCPWDSPCRNTGVGCRALYSRSFWLRDQNCILGLLQWQAGSLPLVPPGKTLIILKYLCNIMHIYIYMNHKESAKKIINWKCTKFLEIKLYKLNKNYTNTLKTYPQIKEEILQNTK